MLCRHVGGVRVHRGFRNVVVGVDGHGGEFSSAASECARVHGLSRAAGRAGLVPLEREVVTTPDAVATGTVGHPVDVLSESLDGCAQER